MEFVIGLAKGAWKFLTSLPWQVYAVALLLLALWLYGKWEFHAGQAEVQTKFDAHLSADRGAEAVAKQRAALREQQDRAAFAVIGATFDQEKTHAAEKGRAVAADVRSGALRLRDHWTCPARDLPDAAGSAEAADGDAALRAADAGDLVQIGAEADAQVSGLQALLQAERAKPIAK